MKTTPEQLILEATLETMLSILGPIGTRQYFKDFYQKELLAGDGRRVFDFSKRLEKLLKQELQNIKN